MNNEQKEMSDIDKINNRQEFVKPGCGKSKPNYRKDRDKSKSRSKFQDKVDKNDYTFYAATEEIAKSLANLPFNVMSGLPYDLQATKYSSTGVKVTPVSQASQAIFRIDYLPSIGVSNQRVDAINMAAVQLYTAIRHVNSGAKNYEAADVMMEVLAVRDIMTEIFECKRALGVANYYNYYNHNLPDLLLKALGFNPDDLRANIAQYRGRLNLIINKFNSFAIPGYFKAFLRSAFIGNQVFGDSDAIRGQLYIYKKAGYYTWSPVTSTSGTSLVYTAHSDSIQNMSARLDIIETQLDAMYLDEDAITMSGDILKLYSDKQGELYTLTQIDEGYTVTPIFDEDALAQIENLKLFAPANNQTLDLTVTYSGLDVTQENQLIKWNPKFSVTEAITGSNYTATIGSTIFNSHRDFPDYKSVLEWSRLISTFDVDVSSSGIISGTLTSAGLEIPINMYMFNYTEFGDSADYNVTPVYQVYPTITTADNAALLSLQQYDWHPIIYGFSGNAAASSLPVNFAGDLKVATVMPADVAININKSAVYSAFYATNMYK